MTEEWDVCAPWEFVFWMKMARSCRDAGKIWVNSEIDVSGLNSRVAKTKFTVMCDVNNPLWMGKWSNLYIRSTKGRNPGEFSKA